MTVRSWSSEISPSLRSTRFPSAPMKNVVGITRTA